MRRLSLVPSSTAEDRGYAALVESFSGVPRVHQVRGRIMGVAAFERFAVTLGDWMAEHDATTEQVGFLITRAAGSRSCPARRRRRGACRGSHGDRQRS